MLTVWLVVCGAELAPPVRVPPITALACSPDGKAIVVGSQAGLVVRSWPALDRPRPLPTALSHVHELAFSPDGKTLAVVGGTPGKRGTIELYAWPEGKRLRQV